jgi:septum formation protein
MAASLILASASPRRRELLAQHGVAFEVVASGVPEVPGSGETPEAFAQRAAREKALAVAGRRPDACVLGADTVVVVDGVILGKPLDVADARRMLRLLSGRAHRVLTAVALVGPSGAIEDVLVQSEVEFHPLAAGEIEQYLATDEPFDKAGAYAVQGLGGKFVKHVRGSFSNVIGLPMEAVTELLRRRLPAAVSDAAARP